MPLKILADESVDHRIVKLLRDKDVNVISVTENYRGLPDKEVLKLAKSSQTILLTEDSDFGEWIFVHKKESLGVIFLRYKPQNFGQITETLIKMLYERYDDLRGKFAVITINKVRIREIM